MDYAPLDYVCELTDIPVEDGRFDRILFNQVLEHLPEPGRALAELHRVLKPGGLIFCSVPLFFAEHQIPHDYYRYTRFALRRLFDEAGFEIDRISWLEGYFGTVAYQFQLMQRSLPKGIDTLRAIEPGWRILYLAPLVSLTRRLAGAARGGLHQRRRAVEVHRSRGCPRTTWWSPAGPTLRARPARA